MDENIYYSYDCIKCVFIIFIGPPWSTQLYMILTLLSSLVSLLIVEDQYGWYWRLLLQTPPFQ